MDVLHQSVEGGNSSAVPTDVSYLTESCFSLDVIIDVNLLEHAPA